MSKRNPKILIEDILESCNKILTYTNGMSFEDFANDSKTVDAVIRNFEIIGEASNNIEKHFHEFVAMHPELPLVSAYQMRNAIAHGYFKVDFEIIWKTIHSELPGLYAQIRSSHP